MKGYVHAGFFNLEVSTPILQSQIGPSMKGYVQAGGKSTRKESGMTYDAEAL